MSSSVFIRHHTRYRYDRPVSLSEQKVFLKVQSQSRVPVEKYSLKVRPAPVNIDWAHDAYGNEYARVSVLGHVTVLDIEVELLAHLGRADLTMNSLEDESVRYPFIYRSPLRDKLIPYQKTELVYPVLEDYLDALHAKGTAYTFDWVERVAISIKEDVTYEKRFEPGVQTAVETLTKRKGSCRDFAWLAVQIFRQLGIAARFVSGYLVQLKQDSHEVDFHAWAEAFLPGAGWVGIDATSGLLTGPGHIPLAMTPFPEEAGPVIGFVDRCESVLETQMSVHKIEQSPGYL
ncbi:transglutaminase family protein [bacterium]|nr:transglutaminase family protein [bacterium]